MLSHLPAARYTTWLIPTAIKLLVLCSIFTSLGAEYVSPNFIVDAATQELAEKVSVAAEYHREQLAILWLGEPMRPWTHRCPIKVSAGPNKGAGGRTKFKFDRGEVYGWNMYVQGSVERILDSVIPHEVNHTILACHFRRPLPRWADEGAASLVEHDSERQKQQDLADRLVVQGRRIPLKVLFEMTEYPADDSAVLALYAQGYSLTQFLVQKQGRATFLRFLNDAPHRGWDAAIKTFYEHKNLETLESAWMSWVLEGSPRLNSPSGQVVAKQPVSAGPASVVRSQNPERGSQSRQELIRQAKDALQAAPLARSDEQLEAPNPRGNSKSPALSLPLPAPSPAVRSEVARPQERKPIRPAAPDSIQPLELLRIDEASPQQRPRVSTSTSSTAPRLMPSALPLSPLLQETEAVPTARSAFRETELRIPGAASRRTSDRPREWPGAFGPR